MSISGTVSRKLLYSTIRSNELRKGILTYLKKKVTTHTGMQARTHSRTEATRK